MWTPAAVLAIAVLLRYRPLRSVINSESAIALGTSLVAILVLFETGHLG